MQTKQRLDVPLSLKSVSDSGEFEGYGSVFGVKDSHDDVVVSGAFAASLRAWSDRKALPALLWQHRMDEPVGVYTEMKEDDVGLFVRGRLLIDDDPLAKRAHAHMKAGSLSGPLKGMQRELKGFQKEMAGLAIGAAAAGTAVLGALALPVNAAIGFESKMADIRKVVDGLDDKKAFAQMSDDILTLSTQLPMAAEGIAEIVAAGGHPLHQPCKSRQKVRCSAPIRSASQSLRVACRNTAPRCCSPPWLLPTSAAVGARPYL